MNPTMRGDGTLEWHDDAGRLHRDKGPAKVLPSGREEWYRHGKLHREDGPAVIHANGSYKWYRDGVRHREGAPACVYVNGTEKWYRDGLRHRDDRPGSELPGRPADLVRGGQEGARGARALGGRGARVAAGRREDRQPPGGLEIGVAAQQRAQLDACARGARRGGQVDHEARVRVLLGVGEPVAQLAHRVGLEQARHHGPVHVSATVTVRFQRELIGHTATLPPPSQRLLKSGRVVSAV